MMLTLSKHFQVKGHCCHVILSSLFALGNPFINGMLIHAIVGKFIQLFLSFLLNLDKNKFLRMKVQNINPISHGEKQKCAYLYVLYLKIYRCVCMCVCVCACTHAYVVSRVQLFATPWIINHQASLSMGFYEQEYSVGCHILLQGIFPIQGSDPHLLRSPTLQADSSSLSRGGSPVPPG